MQRTLLLAESDGCSVYQFRNETGDGTMSWYEIFPGAMLSFNDFHMKYFHSEFVPDRRVFVIDHCREGRMEYQAAEKISSNPVKNDNLSFPQTIIMVCQLHLIWILLQRHWEKK